MTKGQLAVIVGSVILLGILYFGCETKTRSQKKLNQERAISITNISIDNLKKEAESNLKDAQISELRLVEEALGKAGSDSLLIENNKRLSAKWYDFGFPAIAGYYAEAIAEIEKKEEAWSIAGTTYVICIQNSSVQKERDFCTDRAIKAFENAISINPENLSNKVNLSLTYVENPPQDNPMKGILMLRELNESNPENTLVLNQLAKLAIRTGQNERAIERLNSVLKIDNENKNAFCLLAQAYQNVGDEDNAKLYLQKCSEK